MKGGKRVNNCVIKGVLEEELSIALPSSIVTQKRQLYRVDGYLMHPDSFGEDTSVPLASSRDEVHRLFMLVM